MKPKKTAENRPLISKSFKWFWIADKCYVAYGYIKKKFLEHFDGVDFEDLM
ncbi:hypothetical protein [Comamonas kerstersii]|uniref:hypothetical protein n=1 Tax=Comamonas kerstersii TaxID=225992 RepID=UPI00345D8A80